MVLFFSSARFVEAFAAKFLFPLVEEEGEEYGQSPVGDGVRDVRFHAPIVEGREDIRFGEHVYDFDCEDKGEEFDGFQIVCEEGGKRHDKGLKAAFDDNYTDYKDTIPHLFHYNALVIVSNGLDARFGSITSGWVLTPTEN